MKPSRTLWALIGAITLTACGSAPTGVEDNVSTVETAEDLARPQGLSVYIDTVDGGHHYEFPAGSPALGTARQALSNGEAPAVDFSQAIEIPPTDDEAVFYGAHQPLADGTLVEKTQVPGETPIVSDPHLMDSCDVIYGEWGPTNRPFLDEVSIALDRAHDYQKGIMHVMSPSQGGVACGREMTTINQGSGSSVLNNVDIGFIDVPTHAPVPGWVATVPYGYLGATWCTRDGIYNTECVVILYRGQIDSHFNTATWLASQRVNAYLIIIQHEMGHAMGLPDTNFASTMAGREPCADLTNGLMNYGKSGPCLKGGNPGGSPNTYSVPEVDYLAHHAVGPRERSGDLNCAVATECKHQGGPAPLPFTGTLN